MPVHDCTTGETRPHTKAELAAMTPVAPTQAERLEAIADRRWRCMTSPLAHHGVTDEMIGADTLARLDSEIATLGLTGGTTPWEYGRGRFVHLTGPKCQALRHAIAARNRAAYERAEALSIEVRAGGEPDIDTGWPA